MFQNCPCSPKLFRSLLAASAAIFVSACLETTTGSVTRDSAESQIRQAHAVYKSRGFTDEAAASLIANSTAYSTMPEEEVETLFVELGLAEKRVDDEIYDPPLEYVDMKITTMVYSNFEPDTGAPIGAADAVEYAARATSCFAGGEPWRDCTLNYHPVDGCFLEGAVLQECKRVSRAMSGRGTLKPADGEKCWNYAKGPSINLPYQAQTQSQIRLAQASAPAAAPVAQTPVRVNTWNRPVCTSAFSNGPAICDPETGC